ncbi:hypothetical protein DFH09DRAFT_1312303 [Mycena vulgaris]|nr:hypothetical protein DFH09DRAFT_1312303 [Mycena vulgaris]
MAKKENLLFSVFGAGRARALLELLLLRGSIAARRLTYASTWRPPSCFILPSPWQGKALPKSKGKGGARERDAAYAIFPVHAVMLAAHCTKLPRLPPSAPAGSSRTASATLPVLPRTLPSLHAFAILHAFMYTHHLAPASVAPPPHLFLPQEFAHQPSSRPSPPRPPLHVLAGAHLCAASPSNFNVYDPEIWDALDLTWEVTLGR